MPNVLPIAGHWESQPTVIVSGLPRSGTSMMMQVLEAGGLPILTDGVREADEDNPRGYHELEAVKRTKYDASWLDDTGGKVAKMVHLLLYDLPTDRPYRVIMMRRKTENVLKSQAAMLKRLDAEGANLDDETLARMYEQQLDQVKDYMDRKACFEYIEVWYGAVIQFASTQLQRVNRFLSGELDMDAAISVVDPSLQRQ